MDFDRRAMLAGLGALLVAPQAAFANTKFKPEPKFEPQRVAYSGHSPGMIVVNLEERFLYHVESPGIAMRYGVGIGRGALTTKGEVIIRRKAKWPSWTPTPAMIRRSPQKYARHAGGMKGGPGNPLGARALYLYEGDHDTMLRIHGTTEPWTIGKAVSNGCVRMVNDHVVHLYERVPVGTQVIIV